MLAYRLRDTWLFTLDAESVVVCGIVWQAGRFMWHYQVKQGPHNSKNTDGI